MFVFSRRPASTSESEEQFVVGEPCSSCVEVCSGGQGSMGLRGCQDIASLSQEYMVCIPGLLVELACIWEGQFGPAVDGCRVCKCIFSACTCTHTCYAHRCAGFCTQTHTTTQRHKPACTLLTSANLNLSKHMGNKSVTNLCLSGTRQSRSAPGGACHLEKEAKPSFTTSEAGAAACKACEDHEVQ